MLNVGSTVTKAALDSFMAKTAAGVIADMRRGDRLNTWIDSVSDGDLEALGYVTDDITAIRAAADALGTLRSIFVGEATLDPAVDFRATIRKLSGLDD